MDIEYYSTGTKFEDMAGYSRAVADERFVHLSGTVGSSPETGEIPESVEDQLINIFNIAKAALAHFNTDFSDVVRTRVYIVSQEVLIPVAHALRERFAATPPANTTLICGIPAPGAKVEIEFTARRRR